MLQEANGYFHWCCCSLEAEKFRLRIKSKRDKVYEHRVIQLTNACPSQDRFTTYGITNFMWVFTLPPVSLQTIPCEGIGKTEVNTCAFVQHAVSPSRKCTEFGERDQHFNTSALLAHPWKLCPAHAQSLLMSQPDK